jgi:NAD(P)H-dependent nitrite reductase small subunit
MTAAETPPVATEVSLTTASAATLTRPTDAGSATVEWLEVCRLDDLAPERGAAALVAGEQVALVRTFDGAVYAVQQLDPYSGAHVISRGIVGTRGETPTIASPMYKQVFDLRTGECLDPVGKEPVALSTWPVEVHDGVVLVGSRPVTREGGHHQAALLEPAT